jgi:D-3-phosphoglycerate dehydrogenase
MWCVLITSTTFSKAAPESVRALQGAGIEVVFTSAGRRLEDHELATLVGEVDGIIAGVDRIGPRSLTAGLPRLKVIARYGVGYDSIDVSMATELGIVVTNTPDANSESVADLVFGLMLVLARHIVEADRAVREGRWGRFLGCELLGKRLGVIGFGRAGKAVAGRAGGFGMDVFAFDTVWDEQAATGSLVVITGGHSRRVRFRKFACAARPGDASSHRGARAEADEVNRISH